MLAPESLTTISYVFEELKECDERQYIDAIKEQYAIRSIEIVGDDAWAFKDSHTWPQNLNFPGENAFRLLNEQGYSRARQEGLRVLLTGEGGDHLYSAGDNWLADLLNEGKLLKIFRELSYIRHVGWRRFLKLGSLQRAARQLLNTIPGGRYLHRRQTAPGWLSTLSREYILRKENKFVFPSFERYASILGMSIARGLSSETYYTSRHGVELRHPYRDRRLVEFIMALPTCQLYARGWYKHVLRTAMQDILPDVIRVRPGKTGLSALFFRGIEREKTFLKTYGQDPDAVWRKYVSSKWLNIQGDFTSIPDKMAREIFIRWLCISYAIWHRNVFQ